MSGGGTQTTTEQSQTSYPQWTQDAQQRTYGMGSGMLENFLRNPQYATAGLTTDQLKGMDLARDSARSIFENPAGSVSGTMPTQAAAASVDTSMNPYLRDVVDTTRNTMTRDWRDKDASLAASSAASAVRGSGGALARGQLARGAQENIGNMTAQLMAAGYGKMKALELANAQFQQQANLSNATTGADYGLKAAHINDQMRTAQLAREQAAQQAIMQGGGLQQQFGQKALDVPWSMLERLLALTPKQTNSQTYGTKETEGGGTSMFQSLLGAGTTLLGAKTAGGGSIAASLLGLASDERLKEDITKLGKDPETGLDQYAYRYKGDPKSYPKVVGPMAQDVEKAAPGSTREIGGRKIIPMSLIDMLKNAKAA